MKNKKNVSQIIFYIAFIVIVFFNFLEQTMFMRSFEGIKPLSNLSIKIACVLLVIKYVLDRFPVHKDKIKGELWSLIVFLIGLIVSYESTGVYVIMPIVLLIINVYNIEIQKIFKVWLIEIITLMLITMSSYAIGIVGEGNLWLREDGTIRYSLGFVYSTFSANYMLYVTIFFLYLRKSKVKYIEIFSLLLLSVCIFWLTNTKAAFAYSLLSLGISLVIKKYNLRKQVDTVNQYSMLIALMSALGLSYAFRYRFFLLELLNQFLTGRLYLGSKAFDNFPITLFGYNINWIYSQEGFNFIDSSYLSILFNYGIVLLVFIVMGYYLLSKTTIARSIYYTAMILCISLHSMFDPQLIAIMYNPSILLFGYLLTDRNNLNQDLVV